PALDNLADSGGDEAIDFDATVPWNPDDALKREMERLEAARQIPLPDAPVSLGAMSAPYSALESHLPGTGLRVNGSTPLPSLLMSDMAGALLSTPAAPVGGAAANAEVARLKGENEEINKLIEEMKQ